MKKIITFTIICLLIIFVNTTLYCQENTFILKNEGRSHNDLDLVKQFDLNDIDWDYFRQTEKRTQVQLFKTSAKIEVLSVKELEKKGIPVDKLKIEKIELDRKNNPIDLNKELVIKSDDYGNTYLNGSKRKVLKRR